MKKLDVSKPVQLADGTPARILCTDLQGTFPILIAVPTGIGTESVRYRKADGTGHHVDSSEYLVNTVITRHEYQRVWKSNALPTMRYLTEDAARIVPVGCDNANYILLGILKYTFEDDELVSVEFIKKGK
jgi:hypothetical protein